MSNCHLRGHEGQPKPGCDKCLTVAAQDYIKTFRKWARRMRSQKRASIYMKRKFRPSTELRERINSIWRKQK